MRKLMINKLPETWIKKKRMKLSTIRQLTWPGQRTQMVHQQDIEKEDQSMLEFHKKKISPSKVSLEVTLLTYGIQELVRFQVQVQINTIITQNLVTKEMGRHPKKTKRRKNLIRKKLLRTKEKVLVF